MLTLPLTITTRSQTAMPAHAQFVTGDNPRKWIEELVRWPIDDSELRLIVVPFSRSDLRPIGVLAFNRDGTPLSLLSNSLSTQTTGYGLIGSQVYIPCDGVLEPAVSDKELTELLVPDRTYVWHPTAGLIAADSNDLLSVSDLFLTPDKTSASWNEAHCGTGWAKQLISVSLTPGVEPTANEAIQGGRDNIGSKASEIESIEPIDGPDGSPSEPRNSAMDKAINAGTKGFAKFIRAMTDMAPQGASGRTWVNKLEDWASGKIEKINERIEQERFKELFRLQKLLEQNPEEGLRYALPLNSTGNHRGNAAPSSQLSRNSTNFSLSGLSGGGPADHWDVPNDLRLQLNRQYRELAEREINLGRYRRAAYIHGNLLSDLNAAARTLETGKHYREAAVIYRTKLNRNEDAARCLEKGGLWSEVITLREELQQFEIAGDVYTQLGLEDQATAAYKKAVNKKLDEQDLVKAASIQQNQLNDTEAAIKTLSTGWPASTQSNLCLQAIFRIFGNTGRHEEANTWIARIEEAIALTDSKLKTVQSLVGFANTYPNQTTRELAYESTFRIVSTSLVDEPLAGREFLNSIVDLHPEDKLLLRDCSRFQPWAIQARTTTEPANNDESDTPERVTVLPDKVQWRDGINLGRGFLLIGQKNQHVTIMKLSSDLKQLGHKKARLDNASEASFSIAKTLDNQRAIVHVPFDKHFGDQVIFATDRNSTTTTVGSSWIDHGTVGLTQGPHQQWIVIRLNATNELLVEFLSQTGQLISSIPVEFGSFELTIPIPIYCDGSTTYVGLGRDLLTISASGSFVTTEFDDTIKSIRGSVRGMTPRIAVAFTKGVKVIWRNYIPALICSKMDEPQTLITRSGHLVVAADGNCEIYKTSNQKVVYVKAIKIEPSIRLMRCTSSNYFAALTKSGKVCIYRIPMD